jgi:hypothetical protein
MRTGKVAIMRPWLEGLAAIGILAVLGIIAAVASLELAAAALMVLTSAR